MALVAATTFLKMSFLTNAASLATTVGDAPLSLSLSAQGRVADRNSALGSGPKQHLKEKSSSTHNSVPSPSIFSY
jgi:hypothetical protein